MYEINTYGVWSSCPNIKNVEFKELALTYLSHRSGLEIALHYFLAISISGYPFLKIAKIPRSEGSICWVLHAIARRWVAWELFVDLSSVLPEISSQAGIPVSVVTKG